MRRFVLFFCFFLLRAHDILLEIRMCVGAQSKTPQNLSALPHLLSITEIEWSKRGRKTTHRVDEPMAGTRQAWCERPSCGTAESPFLHMIVEFAMEIFPRPSDTVLLVRLSKNLVCLFLQEIEIETPMPYVCSLTTRKFLVFSRGMPNAWNL